MSISRFLDREAALDRTRKIEQAKRFVVDKVFAHERREEKILLAETKAEERAREAEEAEFKASRRPRFGSQSVSEQSEASGYGFDSDSLAWSPISKEANARARISAHTKALCELGNPPLANASDGFHGPPAPRAVSGFNPCATTRATTAATRPTFSNTATDIPRLIARRAVTPHRARARHLVRTEKALERLI